MKTILLIGLGRFGRHIARRLNELGCQVMAVDKEEEKARAVEKYVDSVQIGDSTDEEFLRSLGIGNFDVCIVAIGTDFLASLETTSFLKELGAVKVVSRASRDTQEKFLLRNGADEVVYPEKVIGNWTAERCASDSVFDYMQLGHDFAVYEVAIPEKWAGHSIGEINVRRKYEVSIIALRRAEELIQAPGAEVVLEASDRMLVIGRKESIARLLSRDRR
jgi:trk system potassium uptake protein TrkA